MHLQFHIVQKTERFQEPDGRTCIDLSELLEALSRPGMSRYDDRETVSLPDRLDRIEQGEEIFLHVDVLLAMRTDQKVAVRRHRELFQDARALDFRYVVLQHLSHRRPGLDYGFGFQAFREKITARVLAVGKIDVAHVVDDFPVDLLRSALVE